jgi:hypothetical protein
MNRLRTVNGNIVTDIPPVGQRQGAVRDNRIVKKHFLSFLDEVFSEKRFSTNPGTLEEGKFEPAQFLERPEFFHPLLDAELRIVTLTEEITVHTSEIAFSRDID